MTAHACAPIHPIALIRAPGGLDFPMAADGRVGVQREGASCQRLAAPALALVDTPVCAHDPVLGLVRMAGHGPTAQVRLERMVEGTQDLGTDAPARVMAPATNVRGEGAPHGMVRGLLGAGEEGMALRALSRDGRATGGDEGCEPSQASWALFPRCGMPHRVVAHVQAETVQPWLAVVGLKRRRDPRLPGLQREAQRTEPRGDEVVAALSNRVVLLEHHQGVRVDSHLGRGAVWAVSMREGVRAGRFEAVERDIGQQG